MTIDEEFSKVQKDLLTLTLQTSPARSRQYSHKLKAHFGCSQPDLNQKDFRKALRDFLKLLDKKHIFLSSERDDFERSCEILEKEGNSSCCRVF